MRDRFRDFPSDLARRARTLRLGPDSVPALLAHPDWDRPAPVCLWLHGRTVRKELDPGRYLRWVRAGIAACALDLPGHGERLLQGWDSPARSLDAVEQAVGEIDGVVAALADPSFGGVFDTGRLALGGMSAGGMVTLRRLADEHPFRCACVEGTAGALARLFALRPWAKGDGPHPPAQVARLDPLARVATWRPLPLLALHSRADRVVPVETMEEFVAALRAHYRARGADPGLVELRTWDHTGAPDEHAGFGRFANDAKNIQTAFLRRWLNPVPPHPDEPRTA